MIHDYCTFRKLQNLTLARLPWLLNKVLESLLILIYSCLAELKTSIGDGSLAAFVFEHNEKKNRWKVVFQMFFSGE